MTLRTERVGHVIRKIVSEAIQTQLNDPRIERFTSITRVDVATDLSVAHIHVSVMASEAKRRLTVEALNRSVGRLRKIVRKGIATRTIPQLEFFLDESIQRSVEMVNQLDELMEEQRQHPVVPTEEAVEMDNDETSGAPSEPAVSPSDESTTEESDSQDAAQEDDHR